MYRKSVYANELRVRKIENDFKIIELFSFDQDQIEKLWIMEILMKENKIESCGKRI